MTQEEFFKKLGISPQQFLLDNPFAELTDKGIINRRCHFFCKYKNEGHAFSYEEYLKTGFTCPETPKVIKLTISIIKIN